MPLLVTRKWNGEIHAAIIHSGGLSRISPPLGAALAHKPISQAEASEGIDKLILRHFEEREPGDAYNGA